MITELVWAENKDTQPLRKMKLLYVQSLIL